MTLYVEFIQVQYIDLSEIIQVVKAGIVVISVHLKISTLVVISHVLSAKDHFRWYDFFLQLSRATCMRNDFTTDRVL